MNKARNMTKENKRNEKKSEKEKQTNEIKKFEKFLHWKLIWHNANDCRSTAWSVGFNSLWLSFDLLPKKN